MGRLELNAVRLEGSGAGTGAESTGAKCSSRVSYMSARLISSGVFADTFSGMNCRWLMRTGLAICLLCIGVASTVYSQDGETVLEPPLPTVPTDRPEAGSVSGIVPPDARTLPRGFGTIMFGLSRDEVGERLFDDPNFDYRGEPDVQFLPRREQVVIDTAGFDFVDRGYFQFVDGDLYSIIIKLNTRMMDYFTMYTQLSNTYGHPDAISPQNAVWERGGVRLALERPLSVKYLDLAVFDEIRDEGRMRESDRAAARREFLDQF